MAFDPDKYLAEKTGAAFDPDKYLAQKTGQAPVSNAGLPQDAGLLLLNSATGGFGKNIAALGDTAMKGITGIIGPLSGDQNASFDDLVQNYRQKRDELNQTIKNTEQQSPGMSTVLNLAGAAMTPGLGLLKGLSPVKQGAILGGVAGLGGSDADLTKGQFGQALKDTAVGAGMGAGTSVALNGLLDKLSPEALEDLAERRAVKSTGINKSQYKNLAKNPLLDEEGNAIPGKSQVNDIGKRLLDEGVVSPLASGSDILERSKDLAQKSGGEISDILDTLDKNGPVQTMPDPTKAAEQIQEQLQPPLTNPQGAPYKTMASQNNVVNNILDDINSHGNNPITFDEAQTFKQMLKQAAYGPQGQVVDENAHKAYGIVNKWIEDAAHETAEASNQSGLLDKYINAKKNYNAGVQSQNASFNKEAASAVNRDLGLTDYVSGAAGAAAHGTPGGLIAAGANKAAKAYGNPLIATGARGLSNLFSMPKQGLQSLAQSMSSQGEVGQKLGSVLMEASQRDDIGRNALLFTIMQQPTYRNLLNPSTNNSNPGTSTSTAGDINGGQ